MDEASAKTTSVPGRLQLRRAKGWRLPPGAVSVARPSIWGNPYRIGDQVDGWGLVKDRADAVALFRERCTAPPPGHRYDELRGRDLACWCPLEGPCHAAVLLERANTTGR